MCPNYINSRVTKSCIICLHLTDLTPPISMITNKPKSAQNKREITFTFTCNEPPCTFDCALFEDGDVPNLVACNFGQYTETGLSGVNYTFYVMARDRVGNVGSSVNFTWYIGNTCSNLSF